MQLTFAPVELSDVHAEISRHLDSLPGPTDSFLEEHVRRSSHYRISTSEGRVGFASIDAGSLITQFSLEAGQRRLGQAAFQGLREVENVSAALVPTCDEFHLSHAIDDHRQILKQAYLFETQPGDVEVRSDPRWSLRRASPTDQDFIGQHSGDFFDDVGQRIADDELFLTERDGSCVGFGIIERSQFRHDVASIGMFTIEPFRRTGVGATTIALLRRECARLGLRPVAGCWYYNHASKRTLERAGMVARSRLLRVEY